MREKKVTRTVIQAAPGFYVVHATAPGNPEDVEVVKEAIIAWMIVTEDEGGGSDPLIIPLPITVEEAYYDNVHILEPSGRIVRPHDVVYDNEAQFLQYAKDNARKNSA